MSKATRNVLCKSCMNWLQSHNPEIGTCTLERTSITRYDTQCIYSLVEEVEVPEIETQDINKGDING